VVIVDASAATPPGAARSDLLGWACICGLAAITLSGLYEAGIALPIRVACAVFAGALWIGLVHVRVTRHSLLPRYALLLYALPFIHCFEYVVYDISTFADRAFIWGMRANEYEKDLRIIERMTLAGAIGALALIAGMAGAGAFARRRSPVRESGKRLQWLPFAFVAALAVVLSWASAPAQTIFQSAYTQSVSPLEGKNMNAAYLLSYVFVSMLAIDALSERRRPVRRWKILVTGIVAALIVVWFQFLRGDRESMGLIVALAVLSMLRVRDLGTRILRKRTLLGAGFVVLCLVAVALKLGTARSTSVVGIEIIRPDRARNSSLLHGPWSGVSLTPLSVIGDFERDRMSRRWGSTYVDYLLSVPPGVVAAALGYHRPLEATRGPAWEMRYGQGGTHLMVVPYMNFGALGIVVVLGVWGLLIGRVELFAAGRSTRGLLLYATFFVVCPLWIWYGDMLLVRALMCFYGTWWLYRVLPKRGAHDRLQADQPAPAPGGLPGDLTGSTSRRSVQN
jgi:hypothetical protein